MERLFCSKCEAKSINDGKTILYDCTVRNENGFEYHDWYLKPQEIGYHEINCVMRQYEFNGRKRYLPIARLGNFITE